MGNWALHMILQVTKFVIILKIISILYIIFEVWKRFA
jgi:hypothetical protein